MYQEILLQLVSKRSRKNTIDGNKVKPGSCKGKEAKSKIERHNKVRIKAVEESVTVEKFNF